MPAPTPAFTALGKVTARIAACEHLMRQTLGGLEVEAAKRAGNAGPDRFKSYTAKMRKGDFGQLSHRLRTKFKLPDDPWLQILKDAKEMQNAVAHDFWSPNYALLRSETGIEIIVRHCNLLTSHFQYLGEELLHVTGLGLQASLQTIDDPGFIEDTIVGFDEKLMAADVASANLRPWASRDQRGPTAPPNNQTPPAAARR